jgi:hypothetical protein
MLAESEDAARGGFGETFAEAYVLCLRAIPEARRIDDVEDIRETANRLAGYARRAKNSEAEQQSEEIRTLAEQRIRQLMAEAETATKAAMRAQVVAGDVRGRKGGLARAAKLTSERRAEIARVAAAARWGLRARAMQN